MRWCASTSRTGAHAICSVTDKVAAELRATGPDDENVVWHPHAVTRADREARNGHRGAVLWFTGLSGSGKSTVAGALEQALHGLGVSTYLLDGDNVRHGLCRDLGFSDEDRRENIRRVGEVAKLMVDAGLVVLTAFISPHRAERQMVREMLGDDRFIEVFVDTPLAICEARDPKGLYKKRAPASCAISPASTRFTRRRSSRKSTSMANNW